MSEKTTKTQESAESTYTKKTKEELWEEKKARFDELKKKVDKTTKDVFKSEKKFKSYLDVLVKFPKHSINNQLLINSQNPDATRLRTFEEWKLEGRNVSKGEKGIDVYTPRNYTKTEEVNGEVFIEEKTAIDISKFFDISQTYGQESTKKSIFKEVELDEDVIKNYRDVLSLIVPNKVQDINGNKNGSYSRATNQVIIPPDISSEKAIDLLARGMVFCNNKSDLSNKEAFEEVAFRANAVSYVVCGRIGLDVSQKSFANVKDIAKGKDLEELKEFLTSVSTTCKENIKKMEYQMYPILQAKRDHEIENSAIDIESEFEDKSKNSREDELEF